MPDPRPAEPTSVPSAGPSGRRGLAVIGVMTVAVAGWLASQPPMRPPTPVADASLPSSLPGFRADAWFLPDDEQLGFVEIPSGPFRMGSDPDVDPLAFDNERWSTSAAQGTVDVPTFYIGRYEVTVAQFQAFIDATGLRVDPQALSAPPVHPVGSVSWPDALAYCRWLEMVLREWSDTPAEIAGRLRDGWRVSLPSEAEWEKAARGVDGRRFPWGNEPRTDRANFQGSTTMPVGSYPCPECPFALFDMSGNVWELTRSPYHPYPFDLTNTADLDVDALWVMRGGSYTDPPQNARATIRGGTDPGARRPFIGFRVVLTHIVP